ncbi:hypothetical protein [Agromyces archimandritae]|uniref:Uncharacterized protein n=1 Tax=Agromyces archimandritae TaxID=2781962 RepID=A0A975FPX2_9MICO|nr:hypothetical protein [Agromyces archimandritae]QTX05518.1 hypothetical protein G127AT_04690 [Agromyces archimandritae]
MQQSPRRRDIETVAGTPGTIIRRGDQIETLGTEMIDSAELLQRIADGADGQKGLAVDELQDVVGDVYRELKRAGEMYKPTGPVVADYGRVLEDVQPKIKGHVDNCEEYWNAYLALPGFLEGNRPSWGAPEPDSPEADAAADDDRDKQAAYDRWEAEAELFDEDYDTWEDAFEQAADRVGTILDGKIEDGFWDKVDGFVAGALEVLKWVGLALLVASIIIGGPLITALVAIVSIATLALTIYQKIRGDAGWKEVIIAAIAVIPFGSLGKSWTGIADDALGGMMTGAGRSLIRTEVSTIFGSGTSAFRFSGSVVEGFKNGFAQFARNHGTDGRLVDSITRFFTGKAAGTLNSAAPANIVVSGMWTALTRVNSGLSYGTGEGLWSRLGGK